MADVLGRFERMLSGVVEGGARGVFRVRLQPIELAKAATHAMQERQVIGPEGREVPNGYRLRLHPEDFAVFAPYRRSLESKIARYLAQYAEDRGLHPVADWTVELASDEHVRRRQVKVDAAMTDVDAPLTGEVVPLAAGGTMLLPAVIRARGTPSTGDVRLIATLEDGRSVGLDQPETAIGRALDNDLVVADGRVSRYHAQIRREPRGYVVRDLGSTNGTSVAGQRVTEECLVDGDDVSLGGYRLSVRFVPAHGDGTG
ncbi:MAG: DUF3662 domain-containing protein [Chloroflexi bacterium]|nr:DUF3662 domain-containing protein [Chloroflexota bacterium]